MKKDKVTQQSTVRKRPKWMAWAVVILIALLLLYYAAPAFYEGWMDPAGVN